MSKNKGRAGTHTTIIEAARPVVKLLEKKGRVSRGVITAGVGARTQSIKVTPLAGALRVVVVSKGTRQELHVYGITMDEAKLIITKAEFPAYLINFSSE
jgi:hypothetical protein